MIALGLALSKPLMNSPPYVRAIRLPDTVSSVTHLLTERRNQLESLARMLLKAETLDGRDAYAAAGVALHRPEPSTVT
jgi:hypothetical protein